MCFGVAALGGRPWEMPMISADSLMKYSWYFPNKIICK